MFISYEKSVVTSHCGAYFCANFDEARCYRVEEERRK